MPSSFQEHEGNCLPRVGWYRREIGPLDLPADKRVLLHIDAAATVAEVFVERERLGSHLGGWTPFRFDVTDLVRRAVPGQPQELRVRLDEKWATTPRVSSPSSSPLRRNVAGGEAARGAGDLH